MTYRWKYKLVSEDSFPCKQTGGGIRKSIRRRVNQTCGEKQMLMLMLSFAIFVIYRKWKLVCTDSRIKWSDNMTGHQRNFLDIIHFWPHTLSVDRPWLIKLKILDSAWRRRLYTGYWNKNNFTAWSHLRGPYFFVPVVFLIYGKNSNSSWLISQTFIKCKQKYLPF